MTTRTTLDSLLSPSRILRVAAALVPAARRAEWLNDWNSELWYVRQSCSRSKRSNANRDAIVFSFGAFKDAIWVQHDNLKTKFRQALRLQSPVHCLLLLSIIAALVSPGVFYRPGVFAMLIRTRGFIGLQCMTVAMALSVLPVLMSFAVDERAVASRSRSGVTRLRRWSFLGLKLSFLMAIGFLVTFYSVILPKTAVFQGDCMVAGYVLALRWVLTDQKRRCPICLYLLIAESATVGQHSRIFLEVCRRGYCCPRGHGSLYVPEVATSFTRRRWREIV